MKTVFRVAIVVVTAGAVNLYEDYDFAKYMAEHGKSYSAEEAKQREKTFMDNLEKVRLHNREYQAGKHTWWATMNQLADFTSEEFAALRSTKYNPSQHAVVELNAPTGGNPDSVDWREKGAVTKVKNQGGCGSCWAFSATETVESAYQIASGKLLTLAPQTYVNCVKNPDSCGGTGGCEGATMELAFNLTVQTGIALESELPYKARDQECSSYKAAVKCTGFVKNPVNDAAAFETALAKMPQAITVAAGSWQLYGGGIFSGCSKKGLFGGDNTLDHGVQAVGYTQDYWIVRNSWGESWGEQGYIRVSRASDAKTFTDKSPADGVACKPYPKTQTVGGECGIFFDTSYPTGVAASGETVVV
jgi:cathepsin L